MNCVSYFIRKHSFVSSQKYWCNRYKKKGNSGCGSYGPVAEFKARIMNDFIVKNNVHSVIEFGCGDGNQLSLLKIPKYIGLDISPDALNCCKLRFKKDPEKSFFLYGSEYFLENRHDFFADAAFSIDVVYHLTETAVFDQYLVDLFSSADKWVLIYAADTCKNHRFQSPHVKHRKFTEYIKQKFPQWKCVEVIKAAIPLKEDPINGSDADFFVYKKDNTKNEDK